jgi:glutamate-5-semialdehyde dehydrogenase
VGEEQVSGAANAVREAVRAAATAAKAAVPALVVAGDAQVGAVLEGMAGRLLGRAAEIIAANEADYRAAAAGGLGAGLLDRLRIDETRLRGMTEALDVLAKTPDEPRVRVVRDLGDGTLVLEKRRPIGVLGANFEARPNVTMDMASQCLRSRNVVVMRTGSAAIGTAAALVDRVIRPALAEAGLPADAVQLLRRPERESAAELVQQPDLIPLVILRGSGDSTRELSRLAALSGVRTLAHADGGGVLYVHGSAAPATVHRLIDEGLDRLGVCNRLNLLLIDESVWESTLPAVREQLAGHRPPVALSEPPHPHALGREWALDDQRAATITVAPVRGAREAAETANRETSGLAATIAAEDAAAAGEFLCAYAGTGAFWNTTTRLLDGYKLLAVPETGINVDRLPGPRGPVTFRDLYVRQYVVGPESLIESLA